MLVEKVMPEVRCFRHQFEPKDGFCSLCEAKAKANGNFETARKLFVPKRKTRKILG